MKAIVLCAGQGTRLRPHTNDRPKGMVPVGGMSILERQIAQMSATEIDEIVVIGGYHHETIPSSGIIKRINHEYDSTNMVYSLFAAEADLADADAVVVSYADILYTDRVLEAIVTAPADCNVVVDLDWFDYFSERSDDVLSDAETLRLDGTRILELGRRPHSIDEIEGQFIGLMMFRRPVIDRIREIYHAATSSGDAIGWGRPIRAAFMTDLLQELVDQGTDVRAVEVHGGWCEVDTPTDLDLAEAMLSRLNK